MRMELVIKDAYLPPALRTPLRSAPQSLKSCGSGANERILAHFLSLLDAICAYEDGNGPSFYFGSLRHIRVWRKNNNFSCVFAAKCFELDSSRLPSF